MKHSYWSNGWNGLTDMTDTTLTPVRRRLITAAVGDARREGLDCTGRQQRAVHALLVAEPDLTASEAMTLVVRLMQEMPE